MSTAHHRVPASPGIVSAGMGTFRSPSSYSCSRGAASNSAAGVARLRQGPRHLRPVAGIRDRGPARRRPGVGPDRVRRAAVPAAQRRPPEPEAVLRQARDRLHGRPGGDRRSCSSAFTYHRAEGRPRSTIPRSDRRHGFQWQWRSTTARRTSPSRRARHPPLVLPGRARPRGSCSRRATSSTRSTSRASCSSATRSPASTNRFDFDVREAGRTAAVRGVLRPRPRPMTFTVQAVSKADYRPTGWPGSRDHHRRPPARRRARTRVASPPGLLGWLTTTDHKRIGLATWARRSCSSPRRRARARSSGSSSRSPNEHFVDPQTYNEIFTIHGRIMVFLFAAVRVRLANYLVPLQIGAPDMAFPRLNALGTGCSCSAASR